KLSGTPTAILGVAENEFAGDVEISFHEVARLRVNHNKIRHLSIHQCNVTNEFDFLSNDLHGKLVLSEAFLPETTSSDVDWTALNNYHIGLAGEENSVGTNSYFDGHVVAERSIDSTKF